MLLFLSVYVSMCVRVRGRDTYSVSVCPWPLLCRWVDACKPVKSTWRRAAKVREILTLATCPWHPPHSTLFPPPSPRRPVLPSDKAIALYTGDWLSQIAAAFKSERRGTWSGGGWMTEWQGLCPGLVTSDRETGRQRLHLAVASPGWRFLLQRAIKDQLNAVRFFYFMSIFCPSNSWDSRAA